MAMTMRKKRLAAAVLGVGVFAAGAAYTRYATATQDPWIEAAEVSRGVYDIWAGGFTPGHQVVVGGFRPAPGVPAGPGSHWFAGHTGPYANQYGEIHITYTIPGTTGCNQWIPFIGCDENQLGMRCLDWPGPIGSSTSVTSEPSYNYYPCP
jgi:hypothetical protein